MQRNYKIIFFVPLLCTKKKLLSIMKLRVSFTVVAKMCNLFSFFFLWNCIAAGQSELSRLFRMRGMQSEVRTWQEAGNCHRDKYSLCFRGVLSRDIPFLSLSLHPENESPLGNLFDETKPFPPPPSLKSSSSFLSLFLKS